MGLFVAEATNRKTTAQRGISLFAQCFAAQTHFFLLMSVIFLLIHVDVAIWQKDAYFVIVKISLH